MRRKQANPRYVSPYAFGNRADDAALHAFASSGGAARAERMAIMRNRRGQQALWRGMVYPGASIRPLVRRYSYASPAAARWRNRNRNAARRRGVSMRAWVADKDGQNWQYDRRFA